MPSEPQTGSTGVVAGGHDLGQFVDIALLSLLVPPDVSINDGARSEIG
jgi:hypothetical protein